MSSPSSPPVDHDERALVAAFRAGDVRAFETIYRARAGMLSRYAATFVTGDEANDVVQEVFWATWTARERLSVVTGADLSRYLFRAVRNWALNIVNRAHVHDAYVTRQSESPVLPAAIEDLDQSPTDTLLDRVYAVIEILPTRAREVLLLRWHHGLDLEEIAAVMEISYGSVRVLHARAIAMLRERLKLPPDDDVSNPTSRQ